MECQTEVVQTIALHDVQTTPHTWGRLGLGDSKQCRVIASRTADLWLRRHLAFWAARKPGMPGLFCAAFHLLQPAHLRALPELL